MIDIGGPTMVRAAAKNCDSVTVVTSPDQYQQLVDELTANKGTRLALPNYPRAWLDQGPACSLISYPGAVTKDTRRSFAAQAFFATAQ